MFCFSGTEPAAASGSSAQPKPRWGTCAVLFQGGCAEGALSLSCAQEMGEGRGLCVKLCVRRGVWEARCACFLYRRPIRDTRENAESKCCAFFSLFPLQHLMSSTPPTQRTRSTWLHIAPSQIKIKELKPAMALRLDIIFQKVGISANFFSTLKKINWYEIFGFCSTLLN